MQKIQLGLRENWKQFFILVLVNAFVGAMIGIERAIFPRFASEVFGITSASAILSFITAFGLSKAATNYFTGRYANRFGRKNLLVFGWVLALPVSFILIWAPSWSWVIFANVLLGISQGLTWSSTVVMKIDLVGEKERGFAMGLNEFAGYFTLGIVALLSSYIADQYGVTPFPFYLGIGFSMMGLFASIFLVRETKAFAKVENFQNKSPLLKNIFWETSFKNKTLSSITQAGLVNNLNDGMIWGILPILLASLDFSIEKIGILTAIYPSIWGVGQVFTGKLADILSKKKLLFWGMLLQGLAILLLPVFEQFYYFVLISVTLGFGTALVYPTFLAAISEATSPLQRAESIGTFRLWRDLGYAFGAIISGVTADWFGIGVAILLIGLITLTSAMIIQVRMPHSSKKYF